jgi:hypothetical protein
MLHQMSDPSFQSHAKPEVLEARSTAAPAKDIGRLSPLP